jgi:pimeloyl-ACP methyl ester carboxylesterase
MPHLLGAKMCDQVSLKATCSLITVAVVVVPAMLAQSAQVEQERKQIVKNGKASIQVTVRGRGASIVFIPSYGRGVHDFDELSKRLARSGYQAILPEPRGIGSSTGPLDGITLHDLAADVAAVIQAFGGRPVIVVGHAFGNRVARVVATDHPRLVNHLVLLACGGAVPMSAKTREAFERVFDPTLSKEERIGAIRSTFFASGHDPMVWEGGWYFTVAKAQMAANAATRVEEWWAGGSAPILVLQATEDIIAVPENSERLAKEFPDRVRIIQIPKSGHAMLPEQPDLIASTMISNLRP